MLKYSSITFCIDSVQDFQGIFSSLNRMIRVYINTRNKVCTIKLIFLSGKIF